MQVTFLIQNTVTAFFQLTCLGGESLKKSYLMYQVLLFFFFNWYRLIFGILAKKVGFLQLN